MSGEFSTPRALAEELGLSPATIRAACASGEIAGAQFIRRRWLIHRPTFIESMKAPRRVVPPAVQAPVAGRMSMTDLWRRVS